MAEISFEEAKRLVLKEEPRANISGGEESPHGFVVIVESTGDPLDPNSVNPGLGVRFVTNDRVLLHLNPTDPVHERVLSGTVRLPGKRVS